MEEFDQPWSDPSIEEGTFNEIQETLQAIYSDESAPKELRRRCLEASVRAPQDWHAEAIRTAWSTDDQEWKLTGVFGMRYVGDFESEILEALKSRNPEIHYQAVQAAGNREVDGAWPHIMQLVKAPDTRKNLLLAAIEAAVEIRPREAPELLDELADSEDEEISEAAKEAIEMATAQNEFEDEDEDEEDEEDE